MYALCAFIIVASFATLTVLAPFRLAARVDQLVAKLRDLLLARTSHSLFDSEGRRTRQVLRYVQIGSFLSAIVFVVLGVRHGAIIRDRPDAVTTVVANMLISICAASFPVLLLMAWSWFLSDARACLSLGECGIRSLWLVGSRDSHESFRHHLRARVLESQHVAIVDITGFAFIGKGPGQDGGLLFDVLADTPEVPVSVLLMKPERDALDPERTQSTVFQTVLGELRIGRATYVKRLHRTLKHIEALNIDRPPETRIQVSFYTEKPTARGVFLDDVIFTCPWQTRDGQGAVPLLEISKRSSLPSLFETFRLQHCRLASAAVDRVFVPGDSITNGSPQLARC